MDRVYASGAAGTPPLPPTAPSAGYPSAGNPLTATPATKPGPWWYHMITEELMAVVAAAGIVPAHGDLSQLLSAIEFLISEAVPDAPPSATENQAGIVELATTAEVQAGTDSVRAVTPAGLVARTATEVRAGLVELATAAEVQAGTDSVRAVTPAGFRAGLNAAGNAPVFACRGWGNINTVGTMTVKSGGNVLGVTDHGTGDFTVTMTTALPHENYAVVFGSSGYGDNGQTLYVPALKPAAGSGAQPPVLKTTTAFRVMIGQGYGAAYHDVPDVSFAVFC